MSGWIKIHRSITDHWLYSEKRTYSKLEAWYDILLTVNYSDNKAIIKGKIYEVKRGESILSFESWGKRWNWDKSKVRRFFSLLKKDEMIELKCDSITTHLTVCKYDSYQGERNADETQVKHTRNADETQVKPIEERKKEKKEINTFEALLCEYGFNPELVKAWLIIRKQKKSVNSEIALKGFIREVEKSHLTKDEILQLCIEKSWKGFEASWIEAPKQQITETNFNEIPNKFPWA